MRKRSRDKVESDEKIKWQQEHFMVYDVIVYVGYALQFTLCNAA